MHSEQDTGLHICIILKTFWGWKIFSKANTYDISPNGANASLSCCVSISGLKSPTNMW